MFDPTIGGRIMLVAYRYNIIKFARMTGPDFVIMCTILNTIMQSVSLVPLGIKY